MDYHDAFEVYDCMACNEYRFYCTNFHTCKILRIFA